MSHTSEEVVREFFGQFGSYSDVRKAYEEFIGEDCIWENPGMPPAQGKAAIMALLEGSHEMLRLESTPVDVRNVAAVGSTVFTERVDHLYGAGGKHLLDLPVVGVLEVRDSQIIAWREYADSQLFMGLLKPQ
jgi:limonene-1,2-epoxide hydrolase